MKLEHPQKTTDLLQVTENIRRRPPTCCKSLEHPQKTTDLLQVTDNIRRRPPTCCKSLKTSAEDHRPAASH
jgi:hypothetical protein